VSASVVSLRSSHSSRTAILRLESESESKEMRLRENLARAYETIRAYELLLHDSGDGGRGLGGIADISLLEGMSGDHRPPTMPSNQSAWNDSAQSHPPLPITVLASDPRKLRQLLDSAEKSAQKIIALESKVREQERALAGHERQQTETALKMERANRCLSLMNQPSKYLLERLNEKEVECLALEKRVREAERAVEEAARENKKLEVETSQLKERLQLLLSQRNEISALRTMLESLRREEEGEEEEADSEEGSEAGDDDRSVGFVAPQPSRSPMKQPGGLLVEAPSFQTPLRDRSPPPPPSSPPPPLVMVQMEATRPVTALDLGLSPAAMRSMLERTQPTPSKKRITAAE
jgi:DNA repair exonuclease SbcCD ATPase subunit